MAGMERFYQYEVGVYMVGKHDEVVAAAGADGETTHVVSVEFSDGLYPDVELFLLCGGQLYGCCIGARGASGGLLGFSGLVERTP